MKNKIALRFSILVGIVGLATLARIAVPPVLGHPSNFAPIGAIALFGGCYFSGRFSKFIVPLLSVWVGDLFINHMTTGTWELFYQGFYWQYGSYILMALIGSTLSKRVKPLNVVGTSLGASTLFFLISNFGVWAAGIGYEMTGAGLIQCYVKGIPFYVQTLASDVIYSAIFFGAFELASRKYTVLSAPERA
jgi:hypothetical protein